MSVIQKIVLMNRRRVHKTIYTFLLAAAMQLNVHTAQIKSQPPEHQVQKVEESDFIKKPLVLETANTKVEEPPRYNRFPKGYCTYWVASKREIPWRGNAGDWLLNAQRTGYETGQEPKEGAIVVTAESRIGHVAYVEKVEDGEITISEMNYMGWNRVSTRTIPVSYKRIKGYIY